MDHLFSTTVDPDLKKELEQLNNESFSLVDFALEQRSDRDVAVITRGPDLSGPIVRYTYSDVKKRAKYIAYLLKHYGNVKKGDKVLVLQYNSWSLVVCYWAVHYLGAVAVSAIPEHKYRTHLLRYTNCKAVIAPEHILPDLENELTSKTNVKMVYVTDHAGDHPDGDTYKKLNYQTDVPDSVKDEDALFLELTHSPYSIGDDQVKENEYVVIYFNNEIPSDIAEIEREIMAETAKITRTDDSLWYFTSGTTGKPKGCVHNQIDLAFAGITYGKRVMKCAQGKISATDTLMAGPYAMGSNLAFPFMAGGTVIMDHLINQAVNKPEKIIAAFDNIDLYVSIPTNVIKIIDLLDDPILREKIANIEIITSAGATLPASTFKNFVFKAKSNGLKTVILDGIGTSEVQHIFISNFVDDLVSDLSSIGKLVPGYEAALINVSQVMDGDKLVGVQGELCIRTVNDEITARYSAERQPIGADYIKKTEEVNTIIDGRQFYITGDIAMVKNVNGADYFYLLGRTSDLWNQLANEDRGINDYEAVSVSNQVMMIGGLFETMETVNRELYGPNDLGQVLVADVYPIKLDDDSRVYVVAVNEKHWEKNDGQKEQIKHWNDYFIKKLAMPNTSLIFQSKNDIPRTPPPLLKPLRNKMKEFVILHRPEVQEIWELSLVSMSP